MGYRSEVIIAVALPELDTDDLAVSYTPNDRKLAQELLQGMSIENFEEVSLLYSIIDELLILWAYWGDVVYLKDNNFVLHIEDKKWYKDCKGYENITKTVELIDLLNENFNDKFTFIRLGEDTDDYEELGNGYIYSIRRTISYNG